MNKRILFILLILVAQLCCFYDSEEKKKIIEESNTVNLARILKAEDSRNENQLIELDRVNEYKADQIAVRMAFASGRIPSFQVWKSLSSRFRQNKTITDALAIAARFPMNQFPKEEVFRIINTFALTETIAETLLYLNSKEAFEYALSLPQFENIVAKNLWRSKDHLTKEILKKYYQSIPEATVYSIYRSQMKGIVKAEDIKNMGVEGRFFGCMMCDQPEKFLADPAWLVRIAAVKNSNAATVAKRLLSDENPLVRAAALQEYLENHGSPDNILADKLNPMEAEIALAHSSGESLGKILFDKGGIFKEVSAPFLEKNEKDMVLSSHLSDKAKVLFMEKQFGKNEALSYAERLFRNHDSAFALQYLLDQKQGVQKEEIVEVARKKGIFSSELKDYGFLKTEPVNLPLTFYISVLKDISSYKGFKILTQKGTITCTFYHQDAPLTCYNFTQLVKKQYFDRLHFHRVVPAFVAQDGDPTGTGSGGPGYSIRCEYNGLTYSSAGMVGMALAGKDTGGSQYFLTHLPTPHLNHAYTIFARVTEGFTVLSEICQYDQIDRIVLF